MDIAPTILRLAGVEPDSNFGFEATRDAWSARDLSPLMRGDAEPSEFVAFGDLEGSLVSIRTDRYKLVIQQDRPIEVYDLSADRAEQQNIAEREPALQHDLARALVQWRSHFKGKPTFGIRIELDPDAEAQLRALGYLE